MSDQIFYYVLACRAAHSHHAPTGPHGNECYDVVPPSEIIAAVSNLLRDAEMVHTLKEPYDHRVVVGEPGWYLVVHLGADDA